MSNAESPQKLFPSDCITLYYTIVEVPISGRRREGRAPILPGATQKYQESTERGELSSEERISGTV